MIRRRKTISPAPPAKDHILKNGHSLRPGDFFRLLNRPGQRYRFITAGTDKGGDYVTAYGGDKLPLARQQFHTFRADEDFIEVHETKDEQARREAQEAERANIRAD